MYLLFVCIEVYKWSCKASYFFVIYPKDKNFQLTPQIEDNCQISNLLTSRMNKNTIAQLNVRSLYIKYPLGSNLDETSTKDKCSSQNVKLSKKECSKCKNWSITREGYR